MSVFVTGLAYIFWRQGGEIQKIVLTKTNTAYVRSATIIDFVYAFILLFFKEWSDIPMSTTWVFVGLLAGRELAISTMCERSSTRDVFPIVRGDMLRLILGLIVSVVVALLIQYADSVFAS